MPKKYHLRPIVAFLLILVIFFLALFFICSSDFKEFNEMLKTPIILTIIVIAIITAVGYLLFPDFSANLVKMIIEKQVRDACVSENPTQDNVVPYTPESIKKIEKTERNPDLKTKKLGQKDKKFNDELKELIDNGKYEVALEKINNDLHSNNIDEVTARLSQDIVYFSFPDKSQQKDILDNLIALLALPEVKQQPLLKYATLGRLFQWYFKNNDYLNAISVSNQLISIFMASKILNNEQHFYIYYTRALLCERMKDNILAIAYYKEAAKYQENDYFVIYSIACIYTYALANVNKAIDYLQQLMIKTTDDKTLEGHAINTYAYCMAYSGDFQGAYDAIENFLRTNPDASSEVVIALKAKKSYIAFKLGKEEESFSLANQVLAIKPKDDTSINVLSMFKLKEKNYKAVIEYTSSIIPFFEKEFSQNSMAGYYLGEIFYNRGVAYMELNEKQKAKEDFEMANKLNFDEMSACTIIKASITNVK